MPMSLCQRLTGKNSEIIKSLVVKPLLNLHKKNEFFDKWCGANGVKDSFGSLRQLMLLEDFMGVLPEKMIFLNEQSDHIV